MNSYKHDFLMRLIKMMNIFMMTSVFVIMIGKIDNQNSIINVTNVAIVVMFLLLYILFCRIYDAFLVSIIRISEMIYSQVISLFISNMIMYAVVCIHKEHIINLFPFFVMFLSQILISVGWCFFSHKLYFSLFNPKKSIVIFDMREDFEKLIHQYGLDKKFDVQAVFHVEDCINKLERLGKYQTVFLSGVHSHDRNIFLKYCVENDIEIYVIPRVGDLIMSSAKKMHMFHLPMLRVNRYYPNLIYLMSKRLFDVVVSLMAFIILLPIIIITAIFVKMDGGPILYKQKRLTKNAKEFYVLKFRSMKVDAEKDGVARLSTGTNDDRVTPVGKIIRKLRIDELPQLINIIKGDMSIVGPRPERPEISKEYEKKLPEFRLRLQVKAGLTGYAQVYGKYNSTPYDKLQMDLMYIASSSFWEDLRICLATIKILFIPDSTEGVKEGQITAMQGLSDRIDK